jgi:hypothetical protein
VDTYQYTVVDGDNYPVLTNEIKVQENIALPTKNLYQKSQLAQISEQVLIVPKNQNLDLPTETGSSRLASLNANFVGEISAADRGLGLVRGMSVDMGSIPEEDVDSEPNWSYSSNKNSVDEEVDKRMFTSAGDGKELDNITSVLSGSKLSKDKSVESSKGGGVAGSHGYGDKVFKSVNCLPQIFESGSGKKKPDTRKIRKKLTVGLPLKKPTLKSKAKLSENIDESDFKTPTYEKSAKTNLGHADGFSGFDAAKETGTTKDTGVVLNSILSKSGSNFKRNETVKNLVFDESLPTVNLLHNTHYNKMDDINTALCIEEDNWSGYGVEYFDVRSEKSKKLKKMVTKNLKIHDEASFIPKWRVRPKTLKSTNESMQAIISKRLNGIKIDHIHSDAMKPSKSPKKKNDRSENPHQKFLDTVFPKSFTIYPEKNADGKIGVFYDEIPKKKWQSKTMGGNMT